MDLYTDYAEQFAAVSDHYASRAAILFPGPVRTPDVVVPTPAPVPAPNPAPILYAELGDLLLQFLVSTLDLARQLTGTDEEKRAAVVKAATDFYTKHLRTQVRDLIGRPLIFDLVVEPLLLQAIAKVATVGYDTVSRLFSRRGSVRGFAFMPEAGESASIPIDLLLY
jgi:hypothetical protein